MVFLMRKGRISVTTGWSNTLEQIQLDQLAKRLEGSFGDATPFSARELAQEDIDVLQRVFEDDGYRVYLQDQVNRQIIKDYLMNAVILGYVPEQELTGIAEQMTSREGRASLSLQMLMSGVDQAGELISRVDSRPLSRLKPETERPSYIKLIES